MVLVYRSTHSVYWTVLAPQGHMCQKIRAAHTSQKNGRFNLCYEQHLRHLPIPCNTPNCAPICNKGRNDNIARRVLCDRPPRAKVLTKSPSWGPYHQSVCGNQVVAQIFFDKESIIHQVAQLILILIYYFLTKMPPSRKAFSISFMSKELHF